MQPFLFLFVLGTGLSHLASAGTHGVNLRTFVYPGVLCMAVMFTAMFSAASIVWDREFGFLREMMVAPVRRSSLVLGKCLGGATVAEFARRDRDRLAGLVGVPYDAGADARRCSALQLLLAFSITAFGVMVAARITPDAVVHGAHADDHDADVLPLGRDVPGVRPARVADGPQPARSADLRGRPDAPRWCSPTCTSAPPRGTRSTRA